GQTSAAGATAGSIRGMGGCVMACWSQPGVLWNTAGSIRGMGGCVGSVGSMGGAAEAALAAPGTRNDSGATTNPSAKRVSSPSVFGDFQRVAGVGAGAGGATDRR